MRLWNSACSKVACIYESDEDFPSCYMQKPYWEDKASLVHEQSVKRLMRILTTIDKVENDGRKIF